MAFPTGWGWSAPITIPALKISGTNSNFPILLTEANFPTAMIDGGTSSALNGGGDVRFSEDSSGLVQLPSEIVSFVTGITPAAEVYVKLPTLNAGADKIIYVWYSNPGQVQPLVISPFGRNTVWADYETVLHFNSTVNSTGGSPLVVHPAASLAGGALVGNRTSNSYGTVSYNTTGFIKISVQATFEMNTIAGPTWPVIADGHFDEGVLVVAGSGDLYDLSRNTAGLTPAFLTAGPRYIISHTVNNSGQSTLYKNGAYLKSGLPVGVINQDISNMGLLSTVGGTDRTDGRLYELRITNNIELSAGRVATEYNNQSSPSTFATAGIPVASGAVTFVPNDAAGSHVAGNITLSQSQSMAVQDTNHGQRAGNVTLAQGQALYVNGAAHALSSDIGAFIQGQAIAVAAATNILSSDSPALSQNQTLPVHDSAHSVASDNVTLAQIQALAIQNATHGLTGGNVTFNPTPVTPNPDRTYIAPGSNRTVTVSVTGRTIYPINSRTLRI